MLDQKKLKAHGVRYARALQIAVRTAGMLSADHQVATGPIQQSFEVLQLLIKDVGEFTIGFVEGRVMFGNVLTTAQGLTQLENEFAKHGVSAIKFEPGLTQARYKQVIALLATPLKRVEELGGTEVFLQRNPVEGVRFFPVAKGTKRTESGDTILEMDTEAFLRAQAASAPAIDAVDPLAMLFESAGLPVPEGVGVGNPAEIMKLIGPTLDAALTGQTGDPGKAYMALAQVLQGLRPDSVLSTFSPERRQELGAMQPTEMAAEMINDRALEWASREMASAPTGEDAFVVESNVVRVLARSLHATQMAGKLADRLARYVKEYNLPKHICENIQEEVQWVGLPPEEKHKLLLQKERYTRLEFRRLLDHLKELLGKAKVAEASDLGQRFLGFLDRPAEEISSEELSRVPELVRAMAGVRTGFSQNVADKLLEALQRETLTGFKHFQLANSLGSLAQNAATYEEYDLVQAIGSALEQLMAKDPVLHAECCEKIIRRLLPTTAIERLVELFLQKRDDAAWTRNAASMMRRTGSGGIEVLFQTLEDEPTANNRLALIRLIGRMGSAGVEVARQRLTDQRWYVVRNACVVLGELKDPELLQQLTPVLQHEELRVQRAALDAIIKSRAPGRARVLAAVLSHLKGQVQEHALDELIYLKSPEALSDLEQYVFAEKPDRAALLIKAVQSIGAIHDEKTPDILARILGAKKLPATVRQVALNALTVFPSPAARQRLQEFAASSDEPLAASARSAAEKK